MSMVEAKDEHGNTIYNSYGSWRTAVKTAFPEMWIDGDSDIANAMIGPRPYVRGKTISVGEWDGTTGYVNTAIKAPGSAAEVEEDTAYSRPTSKDYVKGDVVEHTKTEMKGIVQGISSEGRLIIKLLGRGGQPTGDTVEWSTGFVRLIKKVQESAGDIQGLIKALHAAFSDSIKVDEKDGVYTFSYPTGISHDASNPHVLSPQNLSKVIEPFFRSFRSAGMTFTQPSGGKFTVSTGKISEGPYTQHGMDNSPDEDTPHNTPWKRDPIAAATDRIHNKVAGALSKFKRSRQLTPGEQLMRDKKQQ